MHPDFRVRVGWKLSSAPCFLYFDTAKIGTIILIAISSCGIIQVKSFTLCSQRGGVWSMFALTICGLMEASSHIPQKNKRFHSGAFKIVEELGGTRVREHCQFVLRFATKIWWTRSRRNCRNSCWKSRYLGGTRWCRCKILHPAGAREAMFSGFLPLLKSWVACLWVESRTVLMAKDPGKCSSHLPAPAIWRTAAEWPLFLKLC